MAVNKVIFCGQPIIDISDSTVTADELLNGAVAYNAKGEKIVGTVTTAPIDSTLTKQGQAADSKAVGDRLGGISFQMIDGEPYLIY